MTTNGNLPLKTTSSDIAATAPQAGSLIARGLEAIEALEAVEVSLDASSDQLLSAAKIAWKSGKASEAIRLVSPAAAQGHCLAQELLGAIYSLCHEDRIRDYVQAYVWYHVASEHMVGTGWEWHINDVLKSRDWVGTLLTPSNLAKAQELVGDWAPTHSGDLHDTWTQYDIGEAYSDCGEGLVKNSFLAVKWWLRAAEGGLRAAQYELGMAYWNGEGVQADLVVAHAWFSISSEIEDTEVKRIPGRPRIFFSPAADECRDNIEQLLTAPEVTEARRRAAEWLRRRGKHLPAP